MLNRNILKLNRHFDCCIIKTFIHTILTMTLFSLTSTKSNIRFWWHYSQFLVGSTIKSLKSRSKFSIYEQNLWKYEIHQVLSHSLNWSTLSSHRQHRKNSNCWFPIYVLITLTIWKFWSLFVLEKLNFFWWCLLSYLLAPPVR